MHWNRSLEIYPFMSTKKIRKIFELVSLSVILWKQEIFGKDRDFYQQELLLNGKKALALMEI